MRIYMIGNDGIMLCREAPATVNEGEIAVASIEELHNVPLSGKRLLALWNALPGVEKRRKVGDREALIDELWAAIEALPVKRHAIGTPDRHGKGTPHRPSDRLVPVANRRVPRASRSALTSDGAARVGGAC